MSLAVSQRRFHVHHRETILGPFDATQAEAFFNRGNVFSRHGAAIDFIDEVETVRVRLIFVFFLEGGPLVALLLGERCKLHVDDGVFSPAAGLLDVAILELARLRYRLPLGDHRLPDPPPPASTPAPLM